MARGYLNVGKSIGIGDLGERVVMRIAISGKRLLRVVWIIRASVTVTLIPGDPHPLQLVRAKARCAQNSTGRTLHHSYRKHSA